MATKRQRPSGSWEYIIKRKGILPKPVSFTFESETEGDSYCARLEALLDRGIVPTELVNDKHTMLSIKDALRLYLSNVAITQGDTDNLNVLFDRIGDVQLRVISYQWAEMWIQKMKHEQQLSPSTIRKYVGALARCFDWLIRRPGSAFVLNPLRQLPKRYSTYTASDAAVIKAVQGINAEIPVDEARDRRLARDEEIAIRDILDGKKPACRQRPLELKWQGALELLFELALETAMRLREIYTISLGQIDIGQRTIFLDKTKNGDRRQVPLSSIAIDVLKQYQLQVKHGVRGMNGWDYQNGLLLPWWNGKNASLRNTTQLLSRQFARIFDAAGCGDFTYHDLRHEATSRIYERTKLSDLQIAKITGHKDPRMLARYANLRGSELAEMLW